MPLPPTAITLHGGCHCSAIRYKIEVPEQAKRFLHPEVAREGGDGAEQDPSAVRIPFACLCHCNNCRETLGSLVAGGICVSAETVWVSCLSRSSEQAKQAAGRAFNGKAFGKQNPEVAAREATLKLAERDRDAAPADRPPYKQGLSMMFPSPDTENTFLNFYHSSEYSTRSFCGRCGTSLSYTMSFVPPGWFEMMVITMGTLDREDLEKWDIGSQLWWDESVDWIKELHKGGHAPIFKTYKPVAAELVHA